MFKKLNLMCVFAALILMWTTHGLALDHPDGPPMEEVDACFNNGGSPDQCCGMIGDAEGRDMCMKDSGEVDACFNSGGSPDQCCTMIDDEHGRNMCLRHSQDGMRHDDRGGDRGDMRHDGRDDRGGDRRDMGPPPAVHECFENGGSPDECCGLMGDEQGKEMCLKHSQEGFVPHDDMSDSKMMCDPEMDYPQAAPGPDGCRDYLDCNGNGAYDLEEPCAEHD